MMQHYSTEILVDYVNGELDAEADASVYLHLDNCTLCRDEYEAEKTLREALVDFGQRSEREMPASLVDAIRTATRPQKTHPIAALGALLRPRIAIPALGGVFSIAIGAFLFTSHPASTVTAPAKALARIDASAFFDHHSDAAMIMPFADRVNAPTFESSSNVSDTGDAGSSL